MRLMSYVEPEKLVETPCIKVCVVDGPSRLCLGCFRSLPEIVRWQRYTAEERAAIMEALPSRRSQIDPSRLP